MPSPVSVTQIATYWPAAIPLRERIVLIQMGVRGLDGQLAAVRHGVARIDGKIEHAFSSWLGSTKIRQMPPASTVSMATVSPMVRRISSDMPPTSLFGSITTGAKGCWREKASSRCVNAAARCDACVAKSA